MDLRILSVNLGRAHVIGYGNDGAVLSGIDKHPVASDMVFVRALGIDGDEQADLSVHGGVDKAVYAYPASHWPWWEGEKRLSCGPATFGENLTLEGGDEGEVSIGDRFRWGDALLEVCQPRGPCYKLGIHTRREDVPAMMTISAKCGWYLRVVAEGMAPAKDARFRRELASGGPNVRDTFRALHDRKFDPEKRRLIADYPALAANWRRGLIAKFAESRP
jgi:MOSC domain-containing protein YiiM